MAVAAAVAARPSIVIDHRLSTLRSALRIALLQEELRHDEPVRRLGGAAGASQPRRERAAAGRRRERLRLDSAGLSRRRRRPVRASARRRRAHLGRRRARSASSSSATFGPKSDGTFVVHQRSRRAASTAAAPVPRAATTSWSDRLRERQRENPRGCRRRRRRRREQAAAAGGRLLEERAARRLPEVEQAERALAACARTRRRSAPWRPGYAARKAVHFGHLPLKAPSAPSSPRDSRPAPPRHAAVICPPMLEPSSGSTLQPAGAVVHACASASSSDESEPDLRFCGGSGEGG